MPARKTQKRLQQRVRGQRSAALASFVARRGALQRQHEEREAAAANEQRALELRHADELAAHRQQLEIQVHSAELSHFFARVFTTLVGFAAAGKTSQGAAAHQCGGRARAGGGDASGGTSAQ